MKLLSTDRQSRKTEYRNIWISEGSILNKHADPESVVLAVDGKIYSPDAECLQEQAGRYRNISERDNNQCAGVIESTDQELQILVDAGYQLTDLRNLSAPQLIAMLFR